MSLLRNPRAITPPSQRIHNWRALPVVGSGPRLLIFRIIERGCNAAIVAFALAAAWLVASQGWNW